MNWFPVKKRQPKSDGIYLTAGNDEIMGSWKMANYYIASQERWTRYPQPEYWTTDLPDFVFEPFYDDVDNISPEWSVGL